MNEIEIYKSADNIIEIQVRFEEDTVWLTQQQLAVLFEQSKQNISLHINNCFKEGELLKDSVVKESLTTASDGKKYNINYYNLDVIISVGYRVKSQRGTQFRQWATQRLKNYLVQGYAINEKRLNEKQQEVEYLKTGIRILSRAIEQQATVEDSEMLKVFASGLDLLDDFDHQRLDKKGTSISECHYPSEKEYLELIRNMRSEFNSDIFALAKDETFDSSINQIQQVFDGKELYPSLEEKAAVLLYLIVKNHSFVDGNKRIGAACFLLFLRKNNLLFRNNKPIISNEALAALTLFVATSQTQEMEIVVKLIVSILNRSK
ncbi:MAG: virulence protein RhuM/Fic/DOC family protein [Paludibacter sp.]|nr:virulence protein RhuM/Fic/DOC family protein [Paludibacter sp.]